MLHKTDLDMSSMAFAAKIRIQSLMAVHSANASHIGSALSIADIVAVLFKETMNLKTEKEKWPDRDRFILSKGHACVAVYACLAELGFFNPDLLLNYGQDGSHLMTHISHKVPGVEFSTGSLGHGLPFGCGKALVAKSKKANWRTFVLLSDGELDEGSNWEAILFAPQHKLDNLIMIVDYNKIQSLGSVAEVLDLEPLAEKLKAFRWAVREIDGHDHKAIRESLSVVPFERGKPSCLIAHTVKGKGVDFMENELRWHYSSPNHEQLESALSQLRNS
jgi:transketolase